MQNVVFRWLDCGELRGKRGDKAPRFRALKNTPLFQTLFSEHTGQAAFVQQLKLCRTALSSANDKNLSRETHPTVCGVPTKSFERLTLRTLQLFA